MSDLVAAHEAALAKLASLKAACRESCDDPEGAVAELDAPARAAATVAHHVSMHGSESVAEALAAGPMRLLSDEHIAEVTRVSRAVADGADPATAAGAEPEHVALLQAARSAHESHREALAAAYAELARTSQERVAAEAG